MQTTTFKRSHSDAIGEAEIVSRPCKQRKSAQKWQPLEDALLLAAIDSHGASNWKYLAAKVPGRTHAQCLQRWNKALRPGLKKGFWAEQEDQCLSKLVHAGQAVAQGPNWAVLSKQIPGRTTKQCRERWFNHLDPSINRDPYTAEQDLLIIRQQKALGNQWAKIARMLNGRTAEAIKIRWSSLQRMSPEVRRYPSVVKAAAPNSPVTSTFVPVVATVKAEPAEVKVEPSIDSSKLTEDDMLWIVDLVKEQLGDDDNEEPDDLFVDIEVDDDDFSWLLDDGSSCKSSSSAPLVVDLGLLGPLVL